METGIMDDLEMSFTKAHAYFSKYMNYTILDLSNRGPGLSPLNKINKLTYTKGRLADFYKLFLTYYKAYTGEQKTSEDKTGEQKTMYMLILTAMDYVVLCILTQRDIDTIYSVNGASLQCGNDIVNMYLTAETAEQRSVGIFINYAIALRSIYIPDEHIPTNTATTCMSPVANVSVSFDSIKGQEDAIENLKKLYTLPYKYPNLFAESSAGVLLYGPPGTGKTLLAKAAVSDFKRVAFFAPKPGDLKGKYVGETEKNISGVFTCAGIAIENPEYDSSVVFIDEFDSVAGAKTEDDPSMVSSVNTLLQEMDGIQSKKNITVIAATNYPWRIEDAILRRFQKRVFVDLANTDAIRSIILQKIQKVYYDKIIEFLGETPEAAQDDVLAFLKSGIWDLEGTPAETRTCSPLEESVYIRLTEKPRIREQPWFDIFGLYNLMNTDVLAADSLAEWNELKSKAEKVNFCISNMPAVEYVVSLFTPDTTGLEIKQSITVDKKVYDTEKNQKLLAGPGLFGYSPSDVEKIMDTAFRDAAYRAAQGVFVKKYGIYIPVSNEYASTIQSHTDLFVTGEYIKSPDIQKVTPIPKNERHRVFNTILTQLDVMSARDTSPTIIRNIDYVNLLHYHILGKMPE